MLQLNSQLHFCLKLASLCLILLFYCAPAKAFENLKSAEEAVITWINNGYQAEEESELIEKLMEFNSPKSAYLFDFVDYFICSRKKEINCEENLVSSLEKAPIEADVRLLRRINKILSTTFTKSNNYNKAEIYSKTCIELSKNNLSDFINCASNEALRLSNNAQFAEAKKLLTSLIPLAEDSNLIEDLARVYINLGSTNQKQHKLDSALNYYDKAYLLLKDNPSIHMAYVLNNMGLIASQLKQYQEAKSYFLRALEVNEQYDKDEIYISPYANLIGYFTTIQNYDSAEYYGIKCLEILKNIQDFDMEMKILNNIGNAAYYTQNYDKAIAFQNKALDIACHMNDSTEIALIKHNIAYSYIYYEKLDSAKLYFDEALAIAQRNENLENQKLALVGLADYYIALNDYENALNYYAMSIEIKDKITNKETRNRYAEMEAKFKTLEKEKIIQEQELAIYKQLEKEQKLKVQIAALIVGIFIIMFLFWFFSYRIKQKNKHVLQQAVINEQEKSIEKIIEAEENERQKIARELHDGIVQDLTLLKMQLNQMGENEAGLGEKLTKVKSDLDKCTNELRSISHEMMPLSLRDLGLEPALNDLLAKSFDLVNVQYQFDAMPMANRLPSKLEITIYRMVQELINNTLKHSKATEVFLSLTFKNNHLIVVYEDNGVGFDIETTTSGIGIANLQSRVKVINGNIRFETSINSGVSAFIRIPFQAPRLK